MIALAALRDGRSHGEESRREVDIRPVELLQFATAEAGSHGQDVGELAVLRGRFDESPYLLLGESPPLPLGVRLALPIPRDGVGRPLTLVDQPGEEGAKGYLVPLQRPLGPARLEAVQGPDDVLPVDVRKPAGLAEQGLELGPHSAYIARIPPPNLEFRLVAGDEPVKGNLPRSDFRLGEKPRPDEFPLGVELRRLGPRKALIPQPRGHRTAAPRRVEVPGRRLARLAPSVPVLPLEDRHRHGRPLVLRGVLRGKP